MGMPQTVFTVYNSSGATLTDAADFGHSWRKVYLEIPTKASSSIYIQGSSDKVTFRRVVETSGMVDFVINSAVTSRIVPVPLDGIRYAKVENTSGITDCTTTFKFICGD